MPQVLSTYVCRLAAAGHGAAGGGRGQVSAAPAIGHPEALCQEREAEGFERPRAGNSCVQGDPVPGAPTQGREGGLATTVFPSDGRGDGGGGSATTKTGNFNKTSQPPR